VLCDVLGRYPFWGLLDSATGWHSSLGSTLLGVGWRNFRRKCMEENCSMITSNNPTSKEIPPAPPPVIKRYLDYLFVECGLAGSTIVAYQRDLCRFWKTVTELGMGVDDLDVDVVRQHLSRLREEGLGISSIARHLTSIRMLLRFLFSEKILKKDIVSLLESPKKWHLLPDTLNYRDVYHILETPAENGEFFKRDKAILELLYATGMRVSELVDLTLSRMNFEVGYVRVIGKGRKERIVPVGSAALGATREYLDNQRKELMRDEKTDAVFLSRTGRPIDRSAIWRCPQVRPPRGDSQEGQPTHTATFLRHPPATRRSRPSRCSGTPRARRRRDDTNLHPRR